MANPSLREKLAAKDFVLAPGIYDGLSALVADKMGFGALYMTGYGTSASLLARPDSGYLTATHMADRVRTICSAVDTPLIADADTGFGGPINVEAAVIDYERGGASGIQLEDQVFPKRCGHTKNREVIARDDAVVKIKMAADARASKDFLIVARTDAYASHGLDECFARADAFLEAGADILFIESPAREDELVAIGEKFKGAWLLANMVEGGTTPIMSNAELQALGFAMAIYPVTGLATAAEALTQVYAGLQQRGAIEGPRMEFADLNKLIGFERIWELDAALGAAKSGD
ncbi:MAG: isocitrate lyase/PEP mutase family protein [Alphaproteobacteria bacterium]